MLRLHPRSPVTKLPPVRRLSPANLRAAWWTVQTARRTRQLLAARGLDAALGPPPPPPLPIEAERGVRGALRRLRGTCLVNAIVLQAWEAAHGLRRDLVVGVTGPEGFRAHAWLQGDPLPAADDAGLDLSVLDPSPDEGRSEAPEGALGRGQTTGDGEGTLSRFDELLRRAAPRYSVRASTRVR
jgi:Transglutaminase-like superfamily